MEVGTADAAAGRFSDAEVRTLKSLVAAFVPEAAAAQIAGLAAQALVRAADPAQVLQLRLVLRLFENPLVNLATAGRPRGLSAMSPADREWLLLRLSPGAA